MLPAQNFIKYLNKKQEGIQSPNAFKAHEIKDFK